MGFRRSNSSNLEHKALNVLGNNNPVEWLAFKEARRVDLSNARMLVFLSQCKLFVYMLTTDYIKTVLTRHRQENNDIQIFI